MRDVEKTQDKTDSDILLYKIYKLTDSNIYITTNSNGSSSLEYVTNT